MWPSILQLADFDRVGSSRFQIRGMWMDRQPVLEPRPVSATMQQPTTAPKARFDGLVAFDARPWLGEAGVLLHPFVVPGFEARFLEQVEINRG